jgi:CRISPR-associated protein Csm4
MMPILTPYALHFKSGLHLGTRGVTLEEAGVSIPSDTLFSALMDVHLRAGGDADAYIGPFLRGSAPFVLTSAFPLVGDVRFYPLPVERTRIFDATNFY